MYGIGIAVSDSESASHQTISVMAWHRLIAKGNN